jgi:hypothetical protein
MANFTVVVERLEEGLDALQQLVAESNNWSTVSVASFLILLSLIGCVSVQLACFFCSLGKRRLPEQAEPADHVDEELSLDDDLEEEEAAARAPPKAKKKKRKPKLGSADVLVT